MPQCIQKTVRNFYFHGICLYCKFYLSIAGWTDGFFSLFCLRWLGCLLWVLFLVLILALGAAVSSSKSVLDGTDLVRSCAREGKKPIAWFRKQVLLCFPALKKCCRLSSHSWVSFTPLQNDRPAFFQWCVHLPPSSIGSAWNKIAFAEGKLFSPTW